MSYTKVGDYAEQCSEVGHQDIEVVLDSDQRDIDLETSKIPDYIQTYEGMMI